MCVECFTAIEFSAEFTSNFVMDRECFYHWKHCGSVCSCTQFTETFWNCGCDLADCQDGAENRKINTRLHPQGRWPEVPILIGTANTALLPLKVPNFGSEHEKKRKWSKSDHFLNPQIQLYYLWKFQILVPILVPTTVHKIVLATLAWQNRGKCPFPSHICRTDDIQTTRTTYTWRTTISGTSTQ